jgi:hypothetical protein
MNRHAIPALAVLAALGAVAVSGVAEAQTPPPKKLYRWVDKDGKVQFSDSLPPEAIDQARTELNPTSGRVVADVGRALTAEEQAAADAAAALEAERAAEAERVRKTEEAMVASFESEEDLRKSVQERISLLQETLNSIEAGIASQRASLTTLLALASETELGGKPVPPKQIDTIRQLHREIGQQQQMLVVKQGELVDADRELEHMLRRYRELKAAQSGDPAPAAGTAPATPPADGAAPAAETPAAEAPAEDTPTG